MEKSTIVYFFGPPCSYQYYYTWKRVHCILASTARKISSCASSAASSCSRVSHSASWLQLSHGTGAAHSGRVSSNSERNLLYSDSMPRLNCASHKHADDVDLFHSVIYLMHTTVSTIHCHKQQHNLDNNFNKASFSVKNAQPDRQVI